MTCLRGSQHSEAAQQLGRSVTLPSEAVWDAGGRFCLSSVFEKHHRRGDHGLWGAGGLGSHLPGSPCSEPHFEPLNTLFRLNFCVNGPVGHGDAKVGREDSAATTVPQRVPPTTHPRRGASQQRNRHGGLGCDNITGNQP